MEEEFQSLVSLGTADFKVISMKNALPVARKKDPELIHAPKVSSGFQRLFPVFYRMNQKNKYEKDEKGKNKLITHEGTFTRLLQLKGQSPVEIYKNATEVFFIPLEFKSARQYYAGAYDENNPKPPDCNSENGVVPETNKFANSCDECPFSKWGEGKQPPKCKELPTILGLDLTGRKIEDPDIKDLVTPDAFTIQFGVSAAKNFKELMKDLAKPVAFDDGSVGQVDMTQYVVKMTASRVIDAKGNETAYFEPEFEIVGFVPFDVSEQILEKLNTPTIEHGNKSPLELFKGRMDPHTGPVTGSTEEEKSEGVKLPPVAKPAKAVTPIKPKEEKVEESPAKEAEIIPVKSATNEESEETVEIEASPTPPVAKQPEPVATDDEDVVF